VLTRLEAIRVGFTRQLGGARELVRLKEANRLRDWPRGMGEGQSSLGDRKPYGVRSGLS